MLLAGHLRWMVLRKDCSLNHPTLLSRSADPLLDFLERQRGEVSSCPGSKEPEQFPHL